MQDDIEHGGMAAYISEVAIDAALIDTPPAEGHASSSQSSCVEDETGSEDKIFIRRLRLPYVVEELGYIESNALDGEHTEEK